ncbi:hypothetical protein [Legionella hackeliae]|uniref:Thioredoxin domain-containing protein n=1 Tax=Legionella hackeliae TaxID=449 RepID=A0A0A8UMX2_LEGHA|nr:hypothetical protein [Legionella hackeliae]KTD08781.1 hypothetical protein Lhac_3004 [Legionella hackeliae]CEK10210.1 conserved membrane protein of unknown function [Legionella hackeliae]
MRFVLKIILSSFLCISLLWADTTPATSSWFTQDENKTIKLQVSLFLSSTCPHCHKADLFFQSIEPNTPWIEVHRYTINKDKATLETFNQFLQQQNSTDFSVPAIFFCNSHWIGFAEPETSGEELLRGLKYCHDQIVKTGQISTNTTNVLRQWANANWYGNAIISKPSVATLIPMMAVSDALNPCSLFLILTLVAFLWLAETRQLRLTAGFLFIVTVGVVHYVQQVHSAFFFQWITWLRIPALIIGLILLTYTLGYLKTLRLNKSYVFLSLAVLSAFGVQAYMQTCTPNFALVFEQWLLTQQFSTYKTIAFEIIYQIFYVLFLLLLILLVILGSKAARFTKYQVIFRKSAHIFLIIVALLLIIYPVAFAQLGLSLLALIIAIIIAVLLRKKMLPLL